MRPNEAFDIVEHIFDVTSIFGYSSERQARPLPQVLIFDLRSCNPVPAPGGIEQVAHDGPLRLQRMAFWKVDLNGQHPGVHVRGSGLLALLADVRRRT
jgi:hypothetical protein